MWGAEEAGTTGRPPSSWRLTTSSLLSSSASSFFSSPRWLGSGSDSASPILTAIENVFFILAESTSRSVTLTLSSNCQSSCQLHHLHHEFIYSIFLDL